MKGDIAPDGGRPGRRLTLLRYGGAVAAVVPSGVPEVAESTTGSLRASWSAGASASGPSSPPAATSPGASALRATEQAPLAEPLDLPVVARLIVEIRSDGSRTLARGALVEIDFIARRARARRRPARR